MDAACHAINLDNGELTGVSCMDLQLMTICEKTINITAMHGQY
jgi:hypothetical protein